MSKINVNGSSTTPSKDRMPTTGMPYAGNPKLYPNSATRVETGKGQYQNMTAYSRPRYSQKQIYY